jgi:hypothetical protein
MSVLAWLAMTDHESNKEPLDVSHINIQELDELAYWAKKFGCTPAQLREAVGAVGAMTKDVEQYLKHQR